MPVTPVPQNPTSSSDLSQNAHGVYMYIQAKTHRKRRKKRTLNPPELELQVVMSEPLSMNAGN